MGLYLVGNLYAISFALLEIGWRWAGQDYSVTTVAIHMIVTAIVAAISAYFWRKIEKRSDVWKPTLLQLLGAGFVISLMLTTFVAIYSDPDATTP